MRRIRVVNLGDVPWYTSQAVYHGIAYAMDGSTPDTITLCSPTTPYVCVGLHQEVEKEVDLEYCEQNGVPVTRREVGGGAVLLDSGQVFWHCIFHESRVPGRVEDVYGLFLTAPVSAYRAMGIPAVHRPVNDIQVEGRKIGGTGAASIGQAMVVVGSLMFDFDHALMARVLKVPSEKFRDKVYRSLQEYVTTIHRELGPAAPSRAEAVGLLLEAFGRTFGAEIYHDELTARERQAVAQQEDRLRSREWIFARGSLPKHGVKIAEGYACWSPRSRPPGASCAAPCGSATAGSRTSPSPGTSSSFRRARSPSWNGPSWVWRGRNGFSPATSPRSTNGSRCRRRGWRRPIWPGPWRRPVEF